MGGRQLPHSVRAEQSVLGAVFVRPAAFPAIDLSADDFFDARCRSVWNAFAELESERTPIDVGTVEAALTRAGVFDAVGGLAFLTELAIVTPTAANVEHYAAIVRQHATARQVVLAASEVVTAGYSGELSGDDLLARLAQAAAGIRPARRADVHAANTLARERLSELARALEAAPGGAGTPIRVPTGLAAFDAVYGGLPRGNHCGLVAPTGHGKTAMCHHIAFHSPAPALVFTFEELRRDAVDRFLSARTGIPGIRITSGQLSSGEFSSLLAAANDVPNSVHFVDARGMTDLDVARLARRAVPQLGVGVVIVDYLNRVRLSASPKLRTDERMREAVAHFDDACGELDCAWITAAQVNRTPGKENRAPRITDARECAAIEEYSKLGLVVFRPNKAAPPDEYGNTPPDDVIDVTVDKANVGEAPNLFRFGWHGPTMTISPFDGEGGTNEVAY